jgi:hypothetical protein
MQHSIVRTSKQINCIRCEHTSLSLGHYIGDHFEVYSVVGSKLVRCLDVPLADFTAKVQSTITKSSIYNSTMQLLLQLNRTRVPPASGMPMPKLIDPTEYNICRHARSCRDSVMALCTGSRKCKNTHLVPVSILIEDFACTLPINIYWYIAECTHVCRILCPRLVLSGGFRLLREFT